MSIKNFLTIFVEFMDANAARYYNYFALNLLSVKLLCAIDLNPTNNIMNITKFGME